MFSVDRKRYLWVGLSALLQGLLLGMYAVARAAGDGAGGPFLYMPLTLVVLVPFVFWLAQEHWGRRLKRFLLGLSLTLAVFYAYRLWSIYPSNGDFYIVPSQRLDLIRACMATFLLVPFFQCRIATWSWRVPYSDIFFQLCRNVFLLFQAAIVMAVFWGLLLTASLLFDIVGLSFVPYLIFHPLVAVPLTSLTVAVSISVALKRPGIDSLGRWILSVLAWLLPPFSLLSLVFVACLPWSGLRTLWSTGQASSLILLLELGTILLANAAWLDGTRSPFPNGPIESLARLSLLCLPIYTAICIYSLGLRIQQYGLSVDRVQAAFLAIVTGIWGLGYAGAVVLRQWPSSIGRVNMASTVTVALIVAAMNSPLLDPYRLAAKDQADRLLSGQIAPEDFDYLYMRSSLGRYGKRALARIEREADGDDRRAIAIRRRLSTAMAVDLQEHLRNIERDVPPASRRRSILRDALVYPEGRRLGDAMVERLVKEWEADGSMLRSVRRSADIAFVFRDVTTDEEGEDLLAILDGMGMVLRADNDDVQIIGAFSSFEEPRSQRPLAPGTLRPQDVSVLEPRFLDVEIRGRRYQILPLP